MNLTVLEIACVFSLLSFFFCDWYPSMKYHPALKVHDVASLDKLVKLNSNSLTLCWVWVMVGGAGAKHVDTMTIFRAEILAESSRRRKRLCLIHLFLYVSVPILFLLFLFC